MPCALVPERGTSVKVLYFPVWLEEEDVLDMPPVVETWKKIGLWTWTFLQLQLYLLSLHLSHGVQGVSFGAANHFDHYNHTACILILCAFSPFRYILVLSGRSSQEWGWIWSSQLIPRPERCCKLSLWEPCSCMQVTFQSHWWGQGWSGCSWTAFIVTSLVPFML